MEAIRRVTLLLFAFGVGLHTFTAVVMAERFPLWLWLWSLSPYALAGLLWWRRGLLLAALGGLIAVVLVDAAVFYGVFIEPQGSTAAVGLFAAPLWNMAVCLPVGSLIGWWTGRRWGRR
jgi:hypothetical protein